MTNDLVKSGGTHVAKQTSGLASFGQTHYITHEQAAALYGNDRLGSLAPNSVLGALYNIKDALMKIVFKLNRAAKITAGNTTVPAKNEPVTQLAQDVSDIGFLDQILLAILSHAKDGGYHFPQERQGWGKILGTKATPLGKAVEILPKEIRLHVKDGNIDLPAFFLETNRFMDLLHRAFDMMERYRGELGEDQYKKLSSGLTNAMQISGLSLENVAGSLPAESPAASHTQALADRSTSSTNQRKGM